jgi:hypothetical protein
LGEANWTVRLVGLGQLARLDHLRELLHLDGGTRLLLFSRTGFTRDLEREAARRNEVELVSLDRLYSGS